MMEVDVIEEPTTCKPDCMEKLFQDEISKINSILMQIESCSVYGASSCESQLDQLNESILKLTKNGYFCYSFGVNQVSHLLNLSFPIDLYQLNF